MNHPDNRQRRTIGIAVVIIALIVATAVFLRYRWQAVEPKTDVSSVLVLPAKVIGTPELSYLTDAVPGTLSTLLGQIPYLETKLPPSSVEADLFQRNPQRITELYGAQRLLVPTIKAESDKLDLNIELVDPSKGNVVWTRQFKGRSADYNELVRSAADAAGRALRPNQVSLGTTTRGLASNSIAELAYRQGQHFFYRFRDQHREDDFRNALDAFNRAQAADPKLANAAADIGWLYFFRLEDGFIDASEATNEISRWADRALAIDPGSGTALGLKAAPTQWPESDRTQNLTLSLKAASSNSNEPLASRSLVNSLDGSVSLQNAVLAQGARLEPLYLMPAVDIALNVRKLGRPDEGLLFIEQTLQTDSRLTPAMVTKAILLMDQDRLEEAYKLLDSLSDNAMQVRPLRYQWFSAKLIASIARRDVAAEKAAENELAKLRQTSFGVWENRLDLDSVPLLLKFGRTDRAYDILNASLRLGHPPAYDWIMTDPAFTKIRNDKRFKPILDGSHRNFAEMIAMLDQAKARGELPSFLERAFAEIRTQY